jgi:hypothetical protein
MHSSCVYAQIRIAGKKAESLFKDVAFRQRIHVGDAPTDVEVRSKSHFAVHNNMNLFEFLLKDISVKYGPILKSRCVKHSYTPDKDGMYVCLYVCMHVCMTQTSLFELSVTPRHLLAELPGRRYARAHTNAHTLTYM